MWLTVSRRYISIYLHLFLYMFVGYISVPTCLILLTSLSCFWNPITQKFAAKLLRASPWFRSRHRNAPFGSFRDLRAQTIGSKVKNIYLHTDYNCVNWLVFCVQTPKLLKLILSWSSAGMANLRQVERFP